MKIIFKRKKDLTEEELKELKKRKQEEKKVTKLKKTTKIYLISLLLTTLILIFNNILMSLNETYALFIVKYIVNTINGIIYFIASFIPYFNFVQLFILIVLIIIFSIMFNNRKIKIKTRNKYFNYYTILLSTYVFLTICTTFIFNTYYPSHIPNFDTLLFEETKNKAYSEEELKKLNIFLKDKLIYLSKTVPRDKNNRVLLNEDLNKLAIKNLKNISNEIELLKGLYPVRSNNISDKLKAIYGSSTSGLTNQYTTYFDYNSSTTSTLNTIMHEYCHTKGIIRENETVFCSSIAGIKSDNMISNYAGYLEAFGRSNYAYEQITNNNEARIIEDQITSMCLTKNYYELCDTYTKNNNEYILGTENLYISTYLLKYYKNHKKDLIQSLEILKNNKIKFYINNKEVTIVDIINEIDNNTNNYLIIKGKINQKIFNNIKSAISDDRLFLGIYQEDTDEDEPEEIKNPKSFFLDTFPINDEGIFPKLNYFSKEYVYERSARLFLEYFDKNGNI